MPSSTKGRRVRVPFESRCSVRQYAYQDIRGLSKAGQRHTCLPRFLRQRVVSNPGRKGSFTARSDAKSRIQPHLTPGESKNATISWHPASAPDHPFIVAEFGQKRKRAAKGPRVRPCPGKGGNKAPRALTRKAKESAACG